jgi:hypothetical protein
MVIMQVTQAEGYYGDHTDYVDRVAGWCLYVLCRQTNRMMTMLDHAGYIGNVTGE